MTQTIQGFPFASEVTTKFSPVYKQQINQRTIIIPGGGCQYYRGHKGDVCPFCAFPAFSREVNLGPGNEDFFGKWTLDSVIYQQMYLQSIEDNESFDKLAIFNGGSFFPEAELPADFQQFVYEDIVKRQYIKQLMVEAYPSYINERKLRDAKEVLGKTDLMVGVGFESHNDVVRNKMLKKRIDLKLFEQKVHLMQKLDVQVFIYVFLKAPGLTEKQAHDETLATLEYLHNLGVNEMALSCAFVPPNTNLEQLYNRGEFRPPWLWSILKIMEIAAQKGWPLSVGGFEDTPQPVAGPSNCSSCDAGVHTLIDSHRLNGKSLPAQQPECACHISWQNEMSNTTPFQRIL